jgi:hypothetical protein
MQTGGHTGHAVLQHRRRFGGFGMTMQARGFVALWHNVPPGIDEEYNLVHTREHVPDYVANAAGRGGIDSGRRYSEGKGQLPAYFMFYPARDMSAFARLAQKPWPEHPGGSSIWFNAIIDQYRDSWRNNCRLLAQRGGGTGGAACSLIMPLSEEVVAGAPIVDDVLAWLIGLPPVVAVHLGVTDPDIAPNRPPLTRHDTAVGVMVIEGFSRLLLAQLLPEILSRLEQSGIATEKPRYGLYQLAYELRAEELDQVEPFPGRPRRW